MKLFSQSPRWCHLTTALWSLIALECGRNTDITGVAQFLEVIHWRAHGKITDEEFSILYAEWMMISETPTSNTTNNPTSKNGHTTSSLSNTSPSKKKGITNVPLALFRNIVIEKGYSESDLDLFIGMTIHEANLRLINTTISYLNKKATNKLVQNSFSLEVVNQRWISLCEELFFSLDTPGYGVWKFDEVMFFCACLSVGVQGWKTEFELEADVAISTLVATSLQFIRETGANPFVGFTSVRNSIAWDQSVAFKSALEANMTNQLPSLVKGRNTRGVHPAKQEITLVMLKRYLIKKNVGESELASLVQHVKFCAESLVKLVKASGAEEFYLACQPIEHRGSIIGSPRLWQEAVLISSGFVNQINSAVLGSLPPILLFLLTDAERYISGTFRAIEFLLDDRGFIDALPSAISQPPDITGSRFLTNPFFSVQAANGELHENAFRLVMQFRKWNQEGGNLAAASTNYNPLRAQQGNMGTGTLDELRRDPIYQLVLTTLIQYKTLQQLFNAAMFDFCTNHYGTTPSESDRSVDSNMNALPGLCANLVPNGKEMFVELGLEDSKELPMTAQDVGETTFENEDTIPINNNDNISVSSSFVINRRQGVDEASLKPLVIESQVDMEIEDLPIENEFTEPNAIPTIVDKVGTKISDLAAAGRRKSSLMQFDLQHRQTFNQDSKPSMQKSTPSTPNYFKPTATYLAKSTKGKGENLNEPESDNSIKPPSSLKPNYSKSNANRMASRGAQSQGSLSGIPRWESVLDARPQDTTLNISSMPSEPPANIPTVFRSQNLDSQSQPSLLPLSIIEQPSTALSQQPSRFSSSFVGAHANHDSPQDVPNSERSFSAPPSSVSNFL